jgi:hypothetical protein
MSETVRFLPKKFMTIRLLLAGLFFAFPLLLRAESTSAQVHSVSGDAYATLANGKSEKITTSTVLPAGSVVHCSSGTVGLHLMPGADTVVAPGSDVTISTLDYSKDASGEASRKVVLDLHKGTVFNSLVHGDGVSDFSIKTPKGVAAARGTIWSVSVVGNNVSIKVLRGNVVFVSFGLHVNIPGGHGYTTEIGIIYVLTPREIDELIKALVDAGFNVTLTVGGNTTTFPGNPGTTTSADQ